MRPLVDRLMARYPNSIQQARDLILVPDLGIVVCFVSKNASSFLKVYIASLARGAPLRRPTRNPHVLANSGFRGVEDLGSKRFGEILSDPSVPKVTVGREPVDRLVSAYISRVRAWHRERYDAAIRHEWVALRQVILGTWEGRHAARPLESLATDIRWEMLVDHVVATPSGLLDRHLVPQTDYAAVDEVEYDLVGTVESLEDFLRRLCQLVDRPYLDPQDYRLNVSPSEASAHPHITPAQRVALHHRYASDYQFFGYST